MVGGVCLTPIQPDNSDTQKQLQQWLKEIDVDELHQGEDTEDHPVPEPGPRALRGPVQHRLERHEGRVDHTHQSPGHQSHEVHDEEEVVELSEGRRRAQT